MPASENLAKFARSFLGLKTIPEHAILKVEGRAAPIKEYVQQFKAWLLQESQKPGADPNYAKLFEIIPFVDGNGASIDTKWGKFIKETLNPFIAEDNRQKKEKKKTKAVNAVSPPSSQEGSSPSSAATATAASVAENDSVRDDIDVDEFAEAVSETSEDNDDVSSPPRASSVATDAGLDGAFGLPQMPTPSQHMGAEELAELYQSVMRTPSHAATIRLEDAPGFEQIGASPSALLSLCPLPTDNPATPAAACPPFAGAPLAAAQDVAAATAAAANVGAASVAAAKINAAAGACAGFGNPSLSAAPRAGPWCGSAWSDSSALTATASTHKQESVEQESNAIRSLEALLRDDNPTVRAHAEGCVDALRRLNGPISAAGKKRLAVFRDELREQGDEKQARTRSLGTSTAIFNAPEEHEDTQVFRSLSSATSYRSLAAATPPPAASKPAEQQIARICAWIDELLVCECKPQQLEAPTTGYRNLPAQREAPMTGFRSLSSQFSAAA